MNRFNLRKGTKINKVWDKRKADRRVSLIMDKTRTLYLTSLKKGALSISGASCGVAWEKVKGGIQIIADPSHKNTGLLCATLGTDPKTLAKGIVFKVEGDEYRAYEEPKTD